MIKDKYSTSILSRTLKYREFVVINIKVIGILILTALRIRSLHIFNMAFTDKQTSLKEIDKE